MTLHVCIGYVDDQRQCHNSILKFQCGGDESNLTGCSILDAANCSTGEDMCFVTQCTECQAQLGKIQLIPDVHVIYMYLLTDLLAYGGQQVPRQDDGSSEIVAIQPFPFFGENQRELFVSFQRVNYSLLIDLIL